MVDDKNSDNVLKQKEIKRLTDSFGKAEPVKGILSDEEILEYAGDSKAAANIRLEKGDDEFSDKWTLHKKPIIVLYIILLVPLVLSYYYARMGDLFASILFLIILLAYLNYPLYFLYIKDYKKPGNTKPADVKTKPGKIAETSKSPDSFNVYKSQIKDLKKLYEFKETNVRQLIEKRFEPPQITHARFISTVDNCTELFNNQVDVALNMMDLATEHTPEIDREIESKIDVLKSLIEKIDALSNELILNIGESESQTDDNVKSIIEDMENLIDSVDEYE
ncbi:MAG: hypothetical protein IKF11_01180 [Methanobrevibacter sp.]|nr:hypothetical protein [Methanobrevibacter sp.]